jgi:hypothetical protein
MFLRLIEIALGLVLVWALIFQVIFPMIRGTKLFPMSKREAKLQSELENVNQAVREKELEETIKSTKEKEGLK